ncbi:uncharacterized protein LOC103928625 [Pyrus x bretschneideri]|uniref:uncharacterized protein LOC103928625 n=1 Tax=Pyrus x bretschneideri TaxID=225117 RepID=UPI00202FFC73|nr:uncharacterized protein LOC103928625 [Pyrus x bretschneideri]
MCETEQIKKQKQNKKWNPRKLLMQSTSRINHHRIRTTNPQHSGAHLASQIRQVVHFDGGGEKNGIDGILEIEGIVVGKVGSAGNGGSVTFGIVGIVGSAGCGKVGIWVLGSGGRVGLVGRVGNWVEGNGGNVALGSVGTEDIGGNVGNVGFGRDGMVGTVKLGGGAPGVAKRFRAARLKWVLESDNTMDKDKMKKSLGKAMIESLKCFLLFPFGYTL